jgi:hypothetical protein
MGDMADHVNDDSPLRTRWARGEWDSEPDRVDFEHEGYRCRVVRNCETGTLCGYVELPADFPLEFADEGDIRAHGGITFCGKHNDGDSTWVGFDCAHAWDVSPLIVGMSGGMLSSEDASYKNVEFVKKECREIVEQLRVVRTPATRAACRIGGLDAAKEVSDQEEGDD